MKARRDRIETALGHVGLEGRFKIRLHDPVREGKIVVEFDHANSTGSIEVDKAYQAVAPPIGAREFDYVVEREVRHGWSLLVT